MYKVEKFNKIYFILWEEKYRTKKITQIETGKVFTGIKIIIKWKTRADSSF